MKIEQIVPLLILIAGLIYFLIPIIRKKFYTRPKLYIEINPNEGITSARYFIAHIPDESIEFANDPEAKNLYELIWKFNLVIRNNSENAAYSIKMRTNKPEEGHILFKSTVNENKPLAAHEELSIPFEYKQEKISKIKDINNLDSKEPQFFENFKILLDYRNSGNTRFNSLLIVKSKEISYKKILKKEIEKNWC
ncbi:hypothetical protein [Polaribacter vadi]|uniref:Uncharacterized protein n=1 Tax=Polaribacter vadi TaxID=1774273 RepID=A0A1B8U2G9_9FLAO|nr:hypothetical protein [Polaribacter vadi]OBY65979.1 hypothetical protein LPB3_02115 [Polaribacter vadi]